MSAFQNYNVRLHALDFSGSRMIWASNIKTLTFDLIDNLVNRSLRWSQISADVKGYDVSGCKSWHF